MTHKQCAFLDAYLSHGGGNATKAALAAGYSAHTADRIGSRLLKHPAVVAALQKRAAKSSLSVDESLGYVSRIARAAPPERVSASDILAANSLILKAKGALSDKPRGQAVQVTIGFLGATGGLQGATVRVTTDGDEPNNRATYVASESFMRASHELPAGAVTLDVPAEPGSEPGQNGLP